MNHVYMPIIAGNQRTTIRNGNLQELEKKIECLVHANMAKYSYYMALELTGTIIDTHKMLYGAVKSASTKCRVIYLKLIYEKTNWFLFDVCFGNNYVL